MPNRIFLIKCERNLDRILQNISRVYKYIITIDHTVLQEMNSNRTSIVHENHEMHK